MNETLKTIHSLRSTHGNFSDENVSVEDVQTIIEASVRAANASARQSYSIIVIEDKEVVKKLCGYVGSVALLYCIDYTRIIDTAASSASRTTSKARCTSAGGWVSSSRR